MPGKLACGYPEVNANFTAGAYDFARFRSFPYVWSPLAPCFE
jgi:hypothetical protein